MALLKPEGLGSRLDVSSKSKNAVEADSYAVLVSSFTSMIRELKALVLLRSPDSFEDYEEFFLELHQQISGLEKEITALQQRLEKDKKLIPRALELQKQVMAQRQQIQFLSESVPIYAPERTVCAEATVVKEKRSDPIKSSQNILGSLSNTSSNTSSAAAPAPIVIAPAPLVGVLKKPKARSLVPKIAHLTSEDLNQVPKYMCGRLTLEKINSAIDEIQNFLNEKYRIMALSFHQLTDKVSTKYKAFRDLETPETKGLYFFTELDLKETSLKMDNTGKALLNTLCHVGRLKVVGGLFLKGYSINEKNAL